MRVPWKRQTFHLGLLILKWLCRCRYTGAVHLVIFFGCGILLIISVPKYATDISIVPCPTMGIQNITYMESLRPVNCTAVVDGDKREIQYARKFKWCNREDGISDEQYIISSTNCDFFKYSRGYMNYTVTDEELTFPLAFSILMHENVEQVERLLRAIYRPQNFYCIHVDSKAPESVQAAMTAITDCFDNVFLPRKQVNVHWAEYTLLEAELACVQDLLEYPEWSYFINLAGREFPLRTNTELVQILKAYKGANDIDGTPHKRPIAWTDYVWRKEFWRTNQRKDPVPHDFIIVKGSAHIAASRAFMEYALSDPKAQALREWMRDIRVPDEHFYQTLNHNPHLDIPGAYLGDPDLKWPYTRLKIWWNEKGEEKCHGQWVRFICNLGAGDLHHVSHAKHLFVNKLRLEIDPVAFQCLEEWYQNRAKTQHNPDFDLTFYENLDFVKNHV